MNKPTVIIRRPAPADLLNLAKTRFLEGKYENIELLAEELGISRASAYKWAGNSEQLLSQVLIENSNDLFQRARKSTRSRGAKRIRKILMQASRELTTLQPFMQLLERNPEKFLRMATSKSAPVQKTTITLVEELIDKEVTDGYLKLPFDPHTLAYILVRVCESFLYADVIIGETPNLSKQDAALKAILGEEPVTSHTPSRE